MGLNILKWDVGLMIWDFIYIFYLLIFYKFYKFQVNMITPHCNAVYHPKTEGHNQQHIELVFQRLIISKINVRQRLPQHQVVITKSMTTST